MSELAPSMDEWIRRWHVAAEFGDWDAFEQWEEEHKKQREQPVFDRMAIVALITSYREDDQPVPWYIAGIDVVAQPSRLDEAIERVRWAQRMKKWNK